MDFFLKVDLIGCFRELNVRKFRIFFVKTWIFYSKNVQKKFRNFRTFSSRKHQIKSTFRKKSIEKLILINVQPFQKQIKVSTKFHNFKPPEMNIFFSAAGGLPWPSSDPPWPPSDPPKSPQDPPKVGPRRPQSDHESTPESAGRLSSALWNHDLTS